MDKKTGGTAYPVVSPLGEQHSGMMLRDFFAGQALAGLSATVDDSVYDEKRGTVEEWRENERRITAEYCYKVADSMIAERKKQ